MQTIFLSVYDGDTEKNVLRAGTFARLVECGNQLVLPVRGGLRLALLRIRLRYAS